MWANARLPSALGPTRPTRASGGTQRCVHARMCLARARGAHDARIQEPGFWCNADTASSPYVCTGSCRADACRALP
eukprot:4671684-Alexandrium_andersonii.AAC.1